MGKIFVVGIGPGSEEFLTHAARRAVENADILVGGKNALALFPSLEKPKKAIDKNLDEVLKFIKKNRQKNIAILTSGDPGFFSILERILKNFPKEEIEVIPGISSMQLCFARIKETWQDAKFLSLHGRKIENLKIKNHKKIVILTDSNFTPNRIAKFLLKKGNKKVAICENLSTSKERIIESDLESIAKQKFSGNCVVVIFDTGFSNFEKEVFEKVGQIPKGRVAAYKEIARAVGRENAARAVGNALAKNPLPIVVPCHRVIKSDLSLGNFSRGKKMKKSLLRSEGVEFKGDKVKPEFLFTFYHS